MPHASLEDALRNEQAAGFIAQLGGKDSGEWRTQGLVGVRRADRKFRAETQAGARGAQRSSHVMAKEEQSC
eukprot:746152-Hanusia_phi.AAC.3